MNRTARSFTYAKTTLAAAAVFIIAAALRFVGLGRLPLWWDEGWSVYFAGLPTGEMLRATSLDIHPPLYYLALHLWSEAFGFYPATARALSALAGVAVVVAGWALARRLLGQRTALLTGLLLALAPVHVFHAQEARMYALATVLALASWVALLRRENVPGNGRLPSLIYGLVTAAALYTEYYAVLLWIGQMAYVLGRDRDRGLLAGSRRNAWLFLPVGMYLPWVAWAGPRLMAYVTQKQDIEGYGAVDPFTFLWQHLASYAGGHDLASTSGVVPVAAVVLFALLTAIGWRSMRGNRRARWMLACSGLLPIGLAYLLHLTFPFTPTYYERILLAFSPALFVAVAHGALAASARGGIRVALAGAAVLVPSLNLVPVLHDARYPATDYRPLFDTIRRSGDASDRVLCVHPWQYGYAVAYLPPESARPVLVPTDRWADADDRSADLASLVGSSRVLWFPSHESLGRILESEIAAELDTTTMSAYAGWFGDDTLLLAYAAGAQDLEPGGAGAFEEGPTLEVTHFSAEAESGTGLVRVSLRWESDVSSSDDVSLRLVDDNGRVWAIYDFPLADPEQHRALLVPWGTPAVPLYLTLIVSRNGVELPVMGVQDGDHSLHIGTVTVLPAGQVPPRPQELVDHIVDARFDDGLRLLGHSAWTESLAQGDLVPIDLLWLCESAPQSEPVLFIQALDSADNVVAATEVRLTEGTWPPTQWSAGSVVRDPHALLLPADAPPGPLKLIAGLVDPVSREPIRRQEGSHVELGSVEVAPARRTFDRPDIPSMEPVSFGSLVTIDGVEVTPCPDLAADCLLRSDELQVRLSWQARSSTMVRYRSFVHLMCDDRIVSQSDQDPAGESSTAWLPGQYLDDTHRLPLSGVDLCLGGLSLQVGVYDPATGERLAPDSSPSVEDKLVLATREGR